MVRNRDNTWLLPLIAFVVGVLVGWWVIGWGVWPVTYTNSLPQDLRATERDQYLIMVAESYAITGDAAQARERVATWPADQLAADLDTLKGRLMAENAMQASQVQLLSGVLGLAAAPTAAPAAPVAPTSAPATIPARSESLLRTLCTAGLWVVLILCGIAVGIWLYNRWRNAQTRVSGPAIDNAYRAPAGRSVSRPEPIAADEVRPGEPVSDLARREPARREPAPIWPRTAPEAEPHGEETWTEAELPAVPAERPAPSRAPTVKRGLPRPLARPAGPTPAGPSAGALGEVNEYTALYQMGESDYDEAFDITDSDGVYMGQCGLELNDPIGRGHDQAAALQVWLWDTKDPDTQVKILMGEGAYRDTALRDQLAGEHPAIPVRLGTEFELESYNLVLRGKVEKLEYAEQEPVHGVFAELAVHMLVYQKGR